MIICPNCRHKEIDGAMFCSECGTLLEGAPGLTTQNIQRSATDQFADSPETIAARSNIATAENGVSLCILETGEMLALQEREEFTLGRSAEGQPVLPDIDLAPYRGYENGVSRLHASIRIEGAQLLATDLGSVNGTRLNGQKVPPHKPCVLKHGDIITLGKLKLQVIVRR